MSNNYFDMTGVLALSQVTPVIKALFGPHELDEKFPGNGEVYIANIAESSCVSWDCVLENLQELVGNLGLSLPEKAEDDMKQNLKVLAKHFNAENNEKLTLIIEDDESFEDDSDLDSLFTIATAFDDGHGLKHCRTESSWHCSKPRLFEFGGAGDFIGLHVATGSQSDHAGNLGKKLEDALIASDIAKAADVLNNELNRILAGVFDKDKHAAIRSQLSSLLAV